MKKILFIIIFVFSSVVVFSQETENEFKNLKIGVNVGLPLANSVDFFNLKYGVDVAYMFSVDDKFSLGLTTGYTIFKTALSDTDLANEIYEGDFKLIPVGASAQYSISKHIFAGSDVGLCHITNRYTDGGVYVQPKVGYQSKSLEIYASYFYVSQQMLISINSVNLGVAFKLL